MIPQSFRRFARWFARGPHPLRFTPVAIALVTAVSTMWRIQGAPHDIVQQLCGYRGEQLGSLQSFRMIGGAFLIPDGAFVFGVLGLTLALVPLEKRIGALRVATVALSGHVAATLIAGTWAHWTNDRTTLQVFDVGSSVMMLSAASTLAIVTRAAGVWAIVGIGTGLDLALSHDLASFEHLIAITWGVAAGLIVRRRLGRNGDDRWHAPSGS
jgi:hypothetical protein